MGKHKLTGKSKPNQPAPNFETGLCLLHRVFDMAERLSTPKDPSDRNMVAFAIQEEREIID